MRYDEILSLVRRSSPDDWERNGIPLLRRWHYNEPFGDKPASLEPRYHHAQVVFKDDIDVRIAWGAEEEPRKYDAAWLPKRVPYPDPAVSCFMLDLRYRGEAVKEWRLIDLDGHRVVVLEPDLVSESMDLDDPQKSDLRWFVPNERAQYAQLFAALVLPGGIAAAQDTMTAYRKLGVEVH